MRRVKTAVVLIAAIAVMLFAEFGSTAHEPAIVSEPAPEHTSSGQLALLGPIDLVAVVYAQNVTVDCQHGSILDDFDAADLGVAGATITGVTSVSTNPFWHPEGIHGTLDGGSVVIEVTVENPCPVPGTVVADVTGTLSNGDTFVVTVVVA